MGCRRCIHLRIALRRMDPVVALSDPAGHVPLQPRDFERPPPAPAPPRAAVISRHGGLPVPVPCGSSESRNRRPQPQNPCRGAALEALQALRPASPCDSPRLDGAGGAPPCVSRVDPSPAPGGHLPSSLDLLCSRAQGAPPSEHGLRPWDLNPPSVMDPRWGSMVMQSGMRARAARLCWRGSSCNSFS
ncbi:hypothetical protein VPH35_137592 [Triticum aestivum]